MDHPCIQNRYNAINRNLTSAVAGHALRRCSYCRSVSPELSAGTARQKEEIL